MDLNNNNNEGLPIYIYNDFTPDIWLNLSSPATQPPLAAVEIQVATPEANAAEIQVETPEANAAEIQIETLEVNAAEIQVETPVVNAAEIQIETLEVNAAEIQVETPEVNAAEIQVETQEVNAAEIQVETQEVNAAEIQVHVDNAAKTCVKQLKEYALFDMRARNEKSLDTFVDLSAVKPNSLAENRANLGELGTFEIDRIVAGRRRNDETEYLVGVKYTTYHR
jgi:hypothetical protein